jgi:hypothetical protein
MKVCGLLIEIDLPISSSFDTQNTMEFIDKPSFGHTKFKLPLFLVPVIMFAVLFLGILATKVYVHIIMGDSHSESN